MLKPIGGESVSSFSGRKSITATITSSASYGVPKDGYRLILISTSSGSSYLYLNGDLLHYGVITLPVDIPLSKGDVFSAPTGTVSIVMEVPND